MQAFMVDHGRWNRGKSCSEGMVKHIGDAVMLKLMMLYVDVLSCYICLFNNAFHRQQKWGLNTYLYAPKDDYKHRMFWRELYSVEEAGACSHHNNLCISCCVAKKKKLPGYLKLKNSQYIPYFTMWHQTLRSVKAQEGTEWVTLPNCLVEQLMTLIGAAQEHGIEFIYAISPGLDITFSNQKEVTALKRKLDQVMQHV